ncbi:ankyrin repeat and SOCS box protein 18 [Echinops telfairi]|uniref:Ankyrin repeat and SOCS box protein 18 n=1 Tax=Echinops telfairi TaxID=9371 RepID=A0ABM0IK78_ECHTE|nr:ankyrin repeat and SOCS box protein 18 [Echinops telfairi]
MNREDDHPDYPLSSDLVTRLKLALDAGDEGEVETLLCAQVQHADATIELANDDWMKEPSAQLPTAVLLGDLDSLKSLMDQSFSDANVVFEIRADEMEWQVKCPATFGLSGRDGHGCAQVLLEHGASVHLAGGEARDTPLHVAARCALDEHARLYLGHGARVDARNSHGETPLSTACGAAWRPEEDVLKTCASTSTVIEVLFNSYRWLRVSEGWKAAIPEEVFQMHQPFYQSFLCLAGTPRCLQHLCRSAIRKLFGKRCFQLVPLLPLPRSLQDYLLLEPEGILH